MRDIDSISTRLIISLLATLILVNNGMAFIPDARSHDNEQPNLLFILTDDQQDNTFSGMGHPWVQTPNIDSLLSIGTRFENAYIAEPTCTPSRAALFLGNHERVNRLGFSSTHRMTQSQWTGSYPVLLKKSGYRTGYVGKWHIKVDGLEFDEMFDYWDGHYGHGPFYFEQEIPGERKRIITTNRHHTNNALKFLRTVGNDKPFCLSIGYATPHGSKVRKMHQPLDESASLDERLANHPIYGSKYRDLDIAYPLQNPEDPYDFIPQLVMDQEKGRSQIYHFDYDPAMNREHLYRYYQMITEMDEMVGELIDALDRLGLSENTVIIFGSDHGLLLGEYGMGGKALLYDLTAKFPCFIYDPKASKELAGVIRKELVSSLDLTVTLLDYAGVPPTPFMYGRSLKSLVLGEELLKPWRKGLYLENIYTGRDTPLQEGYVTVDWKYIRYFKMPHPYEANNVAVRNGEPVYEMLFSLNDDPGEKSNLASDPQRKAKLMELRKSCDKELAEILNLRKVYAEQYELDNS